MAETTQRTSTCDDDLPLPPPVLSREEAIARAVALVPLMREHSERCLAERVVPAETIAKLKASGLIRIMQPKRYGGSELSRDVACEITQIFARACGSQAWVYHVLVDHAWMLGTYSSDAQNDIWGNNVDTLMSSSFAPVGRARATNGGYVLSGKFGFSSGIDHADWIVVGGMVEDETGPRHFLVPKVDGQVIDDWHVNGLEGTGSKSFQVRDYFVPARRTVPLALLLRGEGPGTSANPAPLYRAPRFGYTSAGFAALAVGMAQSMLHDWLGYMTLRAKGGDIKESKCIVAGQAASEISAAETLYLDAVREGTRILDTTGALDRASAEHIRARVAYCVATVRSAADRMYHASGAALVYRGNNMERQFRNIVTGAQHGSVDWPAAAAGYGGFLFTSRD